MEQTLNDRVKTLEKQLRETLAENSEIKAKQLMQNFQS